MQWMDGMAGLFSVSTSLSLVCLLRARWRICHWWKLEKNQYLNGCTLFQYRIMHKNKNLPFWLLFVEMFKCSGQGSVFIVSAMNFRMLACKIECILVLFSHYIWSCCVYRSGIQRQREPLASGCLSDRILHRQTQTALVFDVELKAFSLPNHVSFTY